MVHREKKNRGRRGKMKEVLTVPEVANLLRKLMGLWFTKMLKSGELSAFKLRSGCSRAVV
jgi:hypothetical protein